MYYESSHNPSFRPLGIYISGGNRKTSDVSKKLPPRKEINGVVYSIHNTCNDKIHNCEGFDKLPKLLRNYKLQ